MALSDTLWAALNQLPHPVTEESVLKCAQDTLPSKEGQDFIKWFQLHSAYLLGRLNG